MSGTTGSETNGRDGTRVLVTGGSGFIGTHLVDALLERGHVVRNLDIAPPRRAAHAPHRVDCDIMDEDGLRAAVRAFRPTHAVHLAARTDMEGATVEDYATNWRGTGHVLAALAAAEGVRRAVLTSTQYVCGPGVEVHDDTTWAPHTVYGQSKVEMEKIVRAADVPFAWTLVRPTNIWGPWHPRYPLEFWRVLRRGLYVHPGREPVIRGYGYVRNVVDQMLRALELPEETVGGRVFYVGDMPVELLEWVGAFSRAITGRDPRVVPRPVVRGIARFGDLVTGLGIGFPLTTSRYRSMTEEYIPPMAPSIAVLGPGPCTLEQGVEETVEWLRDHEGWTVAGETRER